MAHAYHDAQAVVKAATILKAISPERGSYLSETDSFRGAWRKTFWETDYARMKAIKDRHGPERFVLSIAG
jgi:hypothetical protein